MVKLGFVTEEALAKGLVTVNSRCIRTNGISEEVIIDTRNVSTGMGGSVTCEDILIARGWHLTVLGGVLEGSLDNISSLPSKMWALIFVVDNTGSINPGGTIGEKF